MIRSPHHRTPNRPAHRVLLCSALVLLAGCARSPFSSDPDIDRLLRQADQATGAPPGGPTVARARADSVQGTPSALNPETSNPSANELRYEVAPPDRDVNALLEQFAAAQGGLPTGSIAAAPTRTITLDEALAIAQVSGREHLGAEEDYMLAAIRLLIERHLWGPRFFNDLAVGLAGDGDEGRFEHASSIVNTLRATQRLPSGGQVEARAIVNATDQLRERASGGYVQSSRLALSGEIPLLRGAGEVAREDLIQAERDLIYQAREFERFRRTYAVAIANDYFAILEARSAITNQSNQLKSLERLAEATAERVQAGRREAFEADLARNQVIQAQADLASLRERYILLVDRFKVRLGLKVEEPIALSTEVFDLPEPRVSTDDAARAALIYRLDLQNLRDQVDDTRRALRNARNQILPDLNLAGEVSIPTDNDDSTGGLDPDVRELDYSVSATLSLPLDRQNERLRLRAAIINLERSAREYERERDDVIVSVRAALRNIEQARFQLRLAEQQVEINTRRLEGQRLKADQVDPQDVVNAENDKLDAENQRDRATTDLRNAILNYLLESDQLRVGRDGKVLPPPTAEVTR
ncbi:MAG: TolC family protein [Phycisphaerales bacterium]